MIGTSRAVSVVVVNYNVVDLLAECLTSLRAAFEAGETTQVIIVDSSSSDGSPEMVRACFPEFEMFVVSNRGYGAGANAGMALATGEAILILNSDTVIHPGAIRTLSAALFADDQLGIVGPRLEHPDGSHQNTCRRFPQRLTPVFESTILEEWFPANRWVRHYRMTDDAGTDSQDLDWLVGAALMIRRETMCSAGGFDASFWMYGEELEWCYRVRQHGWHVEYVESALVTHHEGASTNQDRSGSRLEFDRGRLRAHRRIHGTHWTSVVTALLRLNYGVQLTRDALKWVIGHRRELRARRIAQYWWLLRSDLDVD